jgi:hypothetical protein
MPFNATLEILSFSPYISTIFPTIIVLKRNLVKLGNPPLKAAKLPPNN